MRKSIKSDIEGYNQILAETEVLKKYSFSHVFEKGETQAIINRLHPGSLKLRVSRIVDETTSTRTLRLTARDGYLPPFQAGQYINLFVEINGIRTSRPYSISSAPSQAGYYDITVRRAADGFVSGHLVSEVPVGTQLESSSPAGQFHHNPLFHGNDLVFLAGGSGITPFMSMIREVTDRGLERRIHLIYGCRTPDDIIFGDELRNRAVDFANLALSIVISEPEAGYQGLSGFINAELIRSLTGGVDGKMFYICGPEAMYRFVQRELETLSIPARRIRREVFGPPADITAQAGWPSAVAGTDRFQVIFNGGTPIEARADEPLMNSLERAGQVLPAQCRSGECSLCRTRLVSGKVYMPQSVRMRKSDGKYGYIHPCMAYPLENLELKL